MATKQNRDPKLEVQALRYRARLIVNATEYSTDLLTALSYEKIRAIT